MRFITEFETNNENYVDGIRKIHKEENLGHEVADKLGWKETGFINNDGLAAIRYSLEIEAFPMDKWIEFKRRFFMHLGTTGLYDPFFKDLIAELESFGKPSGDTVNKNGPV